MRDERGFTLIELMWWLVLSVIVAGGLMLFMIVAIHQENVVSSSAYASQRAQTGLQQLNHDLVQAQNIPDSAASTGNDAPIVISYGASGFSAAFYIPASGSTSPGTRVVWTCITQTTSPPGSCTRTVGSATSTQINGLISASITASDANGNSIASCAGDPNGTGTPLAACAGVTQPGSPQAVFPTAVAVSFTVSNLSQADSTQTHTVAGTTTGATFNTTIRLRNY